MTATHKTVSAALLLNALVMPGSGQILLGQKRKGYALATLAVVLVTLPLARYTYAVMAALQEIGPRSHVAASSFRALSMAWQDGRGFILACMALLAAVWIYGIADVVIFRQKDQHHSQL